MSTGVLLAVTRHARSRNDVYEAGLTIEPRCGNRVIGATFEIILSAGA
jgi:hypothetical protein